MNRFVTPPYSPVLPWGCLLLSLALLAFYLPTISPGVTFSDGGEISTAIAKLGVIHPTGYPIFTVLAHLFVQLPLPFEAAVKISIFNAILAAAASVFATLSTRELALLVDRRSAGVWWRARFADAVATPTPWVADASGLLAGFTLGLAPLLWHQVRIPEVYPLHVLLISAAIFTWVRFEVTRDSKYVVWSALPMGLGLAHHVTMAYVLPAAAILLLLRKPRFFVDWLTYPAALILRKVLRRPTLARHLSFAGWWQFPLACLIGALPLLSYGYLIWATQHTSAIPWGGVDDWDAMVYHATGRQYRHYMQGFEHPDVLKRIGYLPGVVEHELLSVGGVAAAVGLLVLGRRLWPFALFLLALGGANVAHALQYGVSDYKTYYLPGVVVTAVLLGVGAWYTVQWFHVRRSGLPFWMFLAVNVALFGGLAGQLYYLGIRNARDWMSTPVILWCSIGFAAAGVAWTLVQVARSALRERRLRTLRFTTLPATIFVAAAIVYVAAGVVRADDFADTKVVGASHASGVAQEIPPGAVYMTMGDGFLFTQWYYQHVMKQGHHFSVVKLRGPNQTWFRDLYLPSRFPQDCDPLWGKYASDSQAFHDHCEDFEDRVLLPKQESWSKVMTGGYRHLPIRPMDEQKRFRAAGPPIKRGNDARCKSASYRSKKDTDCECWNHYQRPYALDEQCVHTAEDGGMAPMKKIDVYANRVVQDHIEERPVFERNVYTDWEKKAKSPRNWDGPARLRPSGEFALVNRGRTNQFVWSKDVEGFDPCGRETFARVPVPKLSPRRDKPLSWSDRRPYQPNPWPILLKGSYMMPSAKGTTDDSTYRFEPGQVIHLVLEWFERYHYDAETKNRRGKRITHGVRFCLFDPEGNRIWNDTTVTGSHSESKLRIPLAAAAKRGRYVIQGCSVGEIEGARIPEEVPCVRPIMELDVWVGEEPTQPGPLEPRARILAAQDSH